MKIVTQKEFDKFIYDLEEYTTSLYCEGYQGKSAGGIAYINNKEQVATLTIVGKEFTYYIKGN